MGRSELADAIAARIAGIAANRFRTTPQSSFVIDGGPPLSEFDYVVAKSPSPDKLSQFLEGVVEDITGIPLITVPDVMTKWGPRVRTHNAGAIRPGVIHGFPWREPMDRLWLTDEAIREDRAPFTDRHARQGTGG